jgi:hypothetical protein
MWIYIIESLISGIITFIISIIIFNLTINKTNKDKTKPYGINIAFFLLGIILYIVSELTSY